MGATIDCQLPQPERVTRSRERSTLVSLMRTLLVIACIELASFVRPVAASAFEGSIRAVGGPAGAPADLLYTVGTNFMRVEMTATNFPHAIDVVDLRSGEITLIQPLNDTFVRFTPGAPRAFVPPPHAHHPGGGAQVQAPSRPLVGIGPTNFAGMPGMPVPPNGLPPGIGPQAHANNPPSVSARPSMPEMPMPPGGLPPGSRPQAHPQAMLSRPAMPAMSAMSMPPPGEIHLKLKATDETTNLFNYPCRRYEITCRGQIMEIWATDQLLPFQVYLSTEPHRLGPPILEERWGRLLATKKLFPLKAVLRMESGPERYRFEVRSITPRKLTAHETASFEPPAGYVELQPRLF